MLEQLAAIVLTAILSSVFTLALAKWAVDRWGGSVLKKVIADAGPEVERRVRAGAVKAGEELLPKVRDKVREGFEAAISSAASRGVGETLKEVTKSAPRVLDDLDALLGRKR